MLDENSSNMNENSYSADWNKKTITRTISRYNIHSMGNNLQYFPKRMGVKTDEAYYVSWWGPPSNERV